MLDRKSLSIQDIIQTLRMFYDNVDDEPERPPATGGPEERAPSQKEILAGLIAALDPSTVNDV
jgi:beta-catenin-like protein 1